MFYIPAVCTSRRGCIVNLTRATESRRWFWPSEHKVRAWVKSQIAKIPSFLLRQQRLLSHCWVVNVFWVVSQRQSTSWLQIHYCSSPWSDSPVPFKRRRAMKYVACCKCPVVFSDQVSEKNDDVEDLKAKSFPFRKFLVSVYWIDLWVKHALCVQFTVQDQIVQKKILFACGKCTKIFCMAYFLRTAMFSVCTAARKQEISSGVKNLSEL